MGSLAVAIFSAVGFSSSPKYHFALPPWLGFFWCRRRVTSLGVFRTHTEPHLKTRHLLIFLVRKINTRRPRWIPFGPGHRTNWFPRVQTHDVMMAKRINHLFRHGKNQAFLLLNHSSPDLKYFRSWRHLSLFLLTVDSVRWRIKKIRLTAAGDIEFNNQTLVFSHLITLVPIG